MATQSAPFRFRAGRQDLFIHHHDIATHLLKKTHDSEDKAAFIAVASSIANPYTSQCLTESTDMPYCLICHAPKTAVILEPMLLTEDGEPYILIQVLAICAKTRCRSAIDDNLVWSVRGIEFGREFKIGAFGEHMVDRTGQICETCKKRENLQRCGRCKVVAYCGVGCQKADWKKHKKVCKPVEAAPSV